MTLIKTLTSLALVSMTTLYFTGCSSSEERSEQKEVKEMKASDIVVAEGKENVRMQVSDHKEELDKDKKDFYYSLKEKDVKTDASEETFTRVDAQKRVKNEVKDNKVVERNVRIDTPYNYIRIDLLKTSLSKTFIVKCSSCHDDYANGIIGPSLLHKDGAYIYKQLLAYKQKDGANILMQDLVRRMSDEELRAMADEVANFNKEVRALKGEEK